MVANGIRHIDLGLEGLQPAVGEIEQK
ncbi:hypothetical protein MY3296_004841 [Beauveria thailandica]